MAQFALLIVLVLIPDQTTPNQFIYVLGRGLAIFALFALVVAAFFLRPSLTALPEPRAGAPFITSGVYGYIRHPMYSALILFGIGAALYKWSIYAGLVAVGLFLVLSVKYRYEDSLLRNKWPQAIEYQKKVGALFPRSIRPTYK